MTDSLGGIAKDVWAKAVLVALMAIARLQERDMVTFLFSGSPHELTRFDFPKGRAPHQTVIMAVETFVGGGTVFEPWMAAALQAVGEAQFNRADDEQLLETPAAVSPVLRQEPARLTAPAIAGLIEDDPDAPF